MSKTTNTLLAFAVGAGVGAALGILFAPDKGSKTREKIKDGFDDLKEEVKSKLNSYTTPDEFISNLKQYIGDAREKKMIPVLLTPVARRKFDADGKIEETHQEYSALVRKLATEEKALFIDLDTQSMQRYQQFGVENSKLLFCQLKPGEHPNYPDGKDDNTHFNELGARLIAQLVLKEIRTTIPDLLSYINTKKP